MIPDYQTLMRPVLECANRGEARISDVVEELVDQFELTDEEREERLPSGKQTRFANRVHWAKSFLKQGGLVKATKRAHFVITDRGRAALRDPSATINAAYLEQFEEFQAFRARGKENDKKSDTVETVLTGSDATPDEALRAAHKNINAALAEELLERVREGTPAFFEKLIVDLLLAMDYGGTSEDAGRALGRSGDDGIDGVIDQDPLGVDQIYLQAKKTPPETTLGLVQFVIFSAH